MLGHRFDIRTPLNEHFNIPEKYLHLPINALAAYANGKQLSDIITSARYLRKSGTYNLRHLLGMPWTKIIQIEFIALARQATLLEVLQKAADNPFLLLPIETAPKVKKRPGRPRINPPKEPEEIRSRKKKRSKEWEARVERLREMGVLL